MSYIYELGAVAAAGLIWLIFKSRELTAAELKLRKGQKVARERFLRGADVAEPAASPGAASKRAKFGQR